MWSFVLSFKAEKTVNIFKLDNKKIVDKTKKKRHNFSKHNGSKLAHAILQSTFSPQFAFQESGRAFVRLAWKHKLSRWWPELRSLAWWCARARWWTNLTQEFQETTQLISCANSLACFNAACDARAVRCGGEMCLCAASATVCTTKCTDLRAFIEVQRCVC